MHLRRIAIVPVALSLLCCQPACVKDKGWPMETVKEVDVARYAGVWHEIASYPHFFQRGCEDTHATYTVTDDNRVGVKNTCHMSSRDVTIEGYAEVPDAKHPGQLKVHLNVPIIGETTGDYYIIALDDNYDWAVVGHPNRDYLWILSRKPALDAKIIASLLPMLEDKLEYKGVRSKLRCTPQSAGDTESCRAALSL